MLFLFCPNTNSMRSLVMKGIFKRLMNFSEQGHVEKVLVIDEGVLGTTKSRVSFDWGKAPPKPCFT